MISLLGVFIVCGVPCQGWTQKVPAKPQIAGARATATPPANAPPAGVPLPPEALADLLPATVYFRGKTAPLQLRNAGAVRFGTDALVWVALVDTAGYATDVQEKYQFYLVTEAPLRIGTASIAAGAYGGGFVGERFNLMDLGGHTIAEGALESDAAMKRPRPLQLLPETPDAVKLYLGRHWVRLQAAATRQR